MATPQLSPGVLIREVDLTVGRAENVLDNIGAIAGPFLQGPIDDPVDIATEQDLLNVFGEPQNTDAQYEYWMTASSYLSYGGVLKVVRSDDADLKNANAGVQVAAADVKVKGYEDYVENYADGSTFFYGAKNPGTWAENLKVCTIDAQADQRITVPAAAVTAATVGFGITESVSNVVIPGAGSTSAFTGHIKGIITGKDATSNTLDVKVLSRVDTAGTETAIDYAEGSDFAAFSATAVLNIVNNSGAVVAGGAHTATAAVDWYDQQQLTLTNANIFWKEIASKPATSSYANDRSAKNDEIHVVVVDDFGTVSGIKGNILEKHVGLSKAKDAVSAVNAPQKTYYEDFLALNSANLFASANPSSVGLTTYLASSPTPTPTGFSAGYTKVTDGDGLWGQDAQGVTYAAIGNVTYTLTGGKNYSTGAAGSAGNLKAELGSLKTSYELFNNPEIEVDYLIMGPGCSTKSESQAKANSLIAIANLRKDCVATVGPHRADIVNITNTDTQTTNLINFFSPLTSSSYAIFDSGYKYVYDRFNNKFRYVPVNGDVAGLMTRTSVVAFPWFSPAGQQRGTINNAIKLAYNPTKAQRDKIYPARINPVITQPGVGTILFGDKTALGFASAFDRINVRRLFLTIEQALEGAANAQLFELNDDLTRANFRAIVEPFLRDVEAKRGLNGFLVICDETNNTPDVIDNNEFRADIFLKPAKSINYVTLTFVATRTGVSFEEVAGRV